MLNNSVDIYCIQAVAKVEIRRLAEVKLSSSGITLDGATHLAPAMTVQGISIDP
jgi:hypothetical protein